MGLRHQGLTVILVHHAGKNGTQRGASRREDLLDTSIALVRPKDDEESAPHQGAHVVLNFPKTRGIRPDPFELELRLTEYQGRLAWAYSEMKHVDPAVELLKIIWETKPENQRALAGLRGVTPGRVSQLCSKLRKRGWVEPSPSLSITNEGKEAIIAAFPEAEAKMLVQGELAFRDVI